MYNHYDNELQAIGVEHTAHRVQHHLPGWHHNRPVALLRFANNLVERRRKRRVKALHAPSKDFGHLLERGAYLYSSYYFEMLAVENLARVK